MLVERCLRNSSVKAGSMWRMTTVVTKRARSQRWVPGAERRYRQVARAARRRGWRGVWGVWGVWVVVSGWAEGVGGSRGAEGMGVIVPVWGK
jgi:hypothetical protein